MSEKQAQPQERDIVERLLQPMSSDPSEVQRERYLAAQEITRLQRFVDGTIARAAEKAKQAKPQERDIEHLLWRLRSIPDAQASISVQKLGREAADEITRLRAQPSPREVACNRILALAEKHGGQP